MAVELAIDTFGDGALLAARLPSRIEHARAELVEPLVDALRRQATANQGDTDGREPGACHVGFAVERASSLRVSTHGYSDASWTRVIRGLGENRWRSVTLNAWILGPEGTPRDAPASFTFLVDLRGFEWTGAAHLVALQISDELARDVFGTSQDRLTGFTKDAAVQLDAATAYIARGNSALRETRHERAIGAPSGMGVDFSSDWLRGVEWGNVLSSPHLDKLGGKERVASHAPCAVVEELPSNGSPLLYLQLTEDLWMASEAQLDDLRRFLEPALLTSEVARGALRISARKAVAGKAPHNGDASPEPSPTKHRSSPARDVRQMLRVEGQPDPGALTIAVDFDGAVSSDVIDALDRLLTGWYEVGVHGGFRGLFHDMSGIETERQDDTTTVSWSMDMGSAADDALEALLRSLSEFAAVHALKVERVVVS